MKRLFILSRSNLYLIILIFLSAVLVFFHFDPLNGTFVGLIVVITTQLYLPGWLLLRFLNLHHQANWIVRFGWVLLAGLGLTITLGGFFRFLQIPVPIYIVALYILMTFLAVLQPQGTNLSTIETKLSSDGKRSYESWLLYGLLVLCCVIALVVGLSVSHQRFNGWEDQTVFASLADWLAHNPDDPGLLSRQIGTALLDDRWITDGWTYNHAAWVWSSGVPAAQLIWYDLTPLFSWVIPLVIFTLVYELSGRESTSVYSAVGLTLSSLITLDSLAYIPTTITYGQNVFTYLNTLRQFSTAIMLPLVQMSCFSYIRDSRNVKLVVIWFGAVALSFLHPRQVVILYMTVSAFCLLYWLIQPSRRRGLYIIVLLIIIFTTLVIPFAQRKLLESQNPRAAAVLNGASIIRDSATGADLPSYITLFAGSLILRPNAVFYHPIMIVAVVVAFLLLWPMWRLRRLEIIFVCTATVVTLLLLFSPFITEIFLKIVSIRLSLGFVIAIPVGLILGIAFDYLVSFLHKFAWIGILAAAVLTLVLVADPSPLPASPSDQLRSLSNIHNLRDILPADEALLDTFANTPALQLTGRTVILTPNRIASYIVESVPYALVTDGRSSGTEEASAGAVRFYNGGEKVSPFLDTTDLQYLQKWQISFIIIEETHTRTVQLLMQPERFRLVAQTSGYLIFHVLDTKTNEVDNLFARLNALYPYTRFDTTNGFRLDQSISTDIRDIVDIWSKLLITHDNAITLYGLAFSLLMNGNEDNALPILRQLYSDNLQNGWVVTALVHTLLRLNQVDEAKTVLHQALTSSNDGLQAMIATEFLRPSILYQLDDSLIQDIVNVATNVPAAWDLLAVYDQPDIIRTRSALLISRGFLSAADQELNTISGVEIRPEDLWTRASIHLGTGEEIKSLELLEPYNRLDYFAAARFLHPDRWVTNGAGGLYNILQGDTSLHDGDIELAMAYYKLAIQNGMVIAGRIFLAEAQSRNGDWDAALSTLAELDHLPNDAPFWAAVARLQFNPDDNALLIALNRHLTTRGYPVVNAENAPRLHHLFDTPANLSLKLLGIKVNDIGTVNVRALLGMGAYIGCPVRSWNVILFDPTDFSRYGENSQPIFFVPGLLSEWTMTVPFNSSVTPTSISVKAAAVCDSLVQYIPEYTTIQP